MWTSPVNHTSGIGPRRQRENHRKGFSRNETISLHKLGWQDIASESPPNNSGIASRFRRTSAQAGILPPGVDHRGSHADNSRIGPCGQWRPQTQYSYIQIRHMAKRLTDEQLKDVRMVLKDLLKVIKVVSMYPENNPLPQSLRRTFAERLIHIILDTGPLEINVVADRVAASVMSPSSPTSPGKNGLAGLFFATGITQLTFGESLDETGVYKLLDTIKAHQNSGRGESDLAAMLWEAQITGFSFRTIEDVALQDYDGDFKVQEVFQAGRRAGDDLSEEEKTGRWKALFDQKGSQRDPDDSGIFLVDDDHDSGQGDHFEDGGEIVLDSASQGIDISQIQPGPHHQQPAGGTPEHSGQPGQPGQPGPHGPSGSVRQPGQHGSGGAVGSMGTIQGTVFSGGDDASDIDLGVNEAGRGHGVCRSEQRRTTAARHQPDSQR